MYHLKSSFNQSLELNFDFFISVQICSILQSLNRRDLYFLFLPEKYFKIILLKKVLY